MLSCQPVSNANSDPAYALHSSDSGSEFRTEKAGIGSFKRDTSDSSQAALDCSRSGSARTRLGGRFFLRGFDIGDGLLWTVACQDVPQLAPTPFVAIYLICEVMFCCRLSAARSKGPLEEAPAV